MVDGGAGVPRQDDDGWLLSVPDGDWARGGVGWCMLAFTVVRALHGTRTDCAPFLARVVFYVDCQHHGRPSPQSHDRAAVLLLPLLLQSLLLLQ